MAQAAGEKNNANHEPQQKQPEISKAGELSKHTLLDAGCHIDTVGLQTLVGFKADRATAVYSRVSLEDSCHASYQAFRVPGLASCASPAGESRNLHIRDPRLHRD
jgi:hypothetical protein